jgi:hypothetical protein
MRAIRGFSMLTLIWEYVFAERIPTFIFTDERRRILRWDEEETRQKSMFVGSRNHSFETDPNTSQGVFMMALARTTSQQKIVTNSRPLPQQPQQKKLLGGRKRSVRFFTRKKGTEGLIPPNSE